MRDDQKQAIGTLGLIMFFILLGSVAVAAAARAAPEFRLGGPMVRYVGVEGSTWEIPKIMGLMVYIQSCWGWIVRTPTKRTPILQKRTHKDKL